MEETIDSKNNRVLVRINKKFFRPAEVNFLRGNSKKAKNKLDWKIKVNLKKLVKIMLDEEILYSK